jgi:hypothetical protein
LQFATPDVALGLAGESGLAHLGLLAWDETGEPPIPPPTRGSPTEGASLGGEGPDLVHRQRRGSPWWAHGGEAGRRWGTGDGRP